MTRTLAFSALCVALGCGSQAEGWVPEEPATVTLVRLLVAPGDHWIAEGTTLRLTAIGLYSDGHQEDMTGRVGWGGLDAGVATVDETGLATGIAHGVARIEARLDGLVGRLDLPVKGWTPPVVLDSGDVLVTSLDVGMAANGDAIAVWVQHDDADVNHYSLYGNRFTAAAGWSGATLLEREDGPVAWPHVAINDRGEAMVSFEQYQQGDYHLFATRFTPAAGWSGPVLLDDAGVDPHVGIDADGDALVLYQAAWAQTLRARRYDAATGGWESAVELRAGDAAQPADSPDLAVNAAGEAIAVWVQLDGSGRVVMGDRYEPETGWTGARLIDGMPGPADAPRAWIDDAGTAYATWLRPDPEDSTYWSDWATRWAAGEPPAAGSLLETTANGVNVAALAPLPSGDLVGVFSVEEPGPTSSIWRAVVNRHDGGGWQPPFALDDTPYVTTWGTRIGADERGDSLVAWNRGDANGAIIARRHDAAAGWSAPVLLVPDYPTGMGMELAATRAGDAALIYGATAHDVAVTMFW